MRKPILVVMAAILVLALATVAMAADPHVGTWKLNLAKSKFAGPAPKSVLVKFETQENGSKVVVEWVGVDGKALHIVCAEKYDGKDYPMTGNPNADAGTLRRIDTNTFEGAQKKEGKVVETGQEVFSKDGKVLTRTTKGKNAQGQEVINMEVYDRQ